MAAEESPRKKTKVEVAECHPHSDPQATPEQPPTEECAPAPRADFGMIGICSVYLLFRD